MQEGATKEDIERLPKYKFRRFGDSEKQNGEIQESFGGIMTECDTSTPVEHVLPLEDAVCCSVLCPIFLFKMKILMTWNCIILLLPLVACKTEESWSLVYLGLHNRETVYSFAV